MHAIYTDTITMGAYDTRTGITGSCGDSVHTVCAQCGKVSSAVSEHDVRHPKRHTDLRAHIAMANVLEVARDQTS